MPLTTTTSPLRDAISSAAAETDTDSTPEQAKAGNYRKGKFVWNGLTIAIENPRGSLRKGVGKNGRVWSQKMADHYGYIQRTVSEADGDHIDVFVGPNPESEWVFVVYQVNPESGRGFDEHKVMLGYDT